MSNHGAFSLSCSEKCSVKFVLHFRGCPSCLFALPDLHRYGHYPNGKLLLESAVFIELEFEILRANTAGFRESAGMPPSVYALLVYLTAYHLPELQFDAKNRRSCRKKCLWSSCAPQRKPHSLVVKQRSHNP